MSDITTGDRDGRNQRRTEHSKGPKPEDVGDTRGERLQRSVETTDEVHGTSRVRGDAVLEQRPDQEQPTAGYPRENIGRFDPAEALPEGANPSDPEAYETPEGVDDLPSREQYGTNTDETVEHETINPNRTEGQRQANRQAANEVREIEEVEQADRNGQPHHPEQPRVVNNPDNTRNTPDPRTTHSNNRDNTTR